MLDTMEIGRRLRVLRGKKTLQTVSNETGLGVSALTMYELGQRMPRDEAKIILSEYYGISIDALFFAQSFTKCEERGKA